MLFFLSYLYADYCLWSVAVHSIHSNEINPSEMYCDSQTDRKPSVSRGQSSTDMQTSLQA
jgi:hypothetical protein